MLHLRLPSTPTGCTIVTAMAEEHGSVALSSRVLEVLGPDQQVSMADLRCRQLRTIKERRYQRVLFTAFLCSRDTEPSDLTYTRYHFESSTSMAGLTFRDVWRDVSRQCMVTHRVIWHLLLAIKTPYAERRSCVRRGSAALFNSQWEGAAGGPPVESKQSTQGCLKMPRRGSLTRLPVSGSRSLRHTPDLSRLLPNKV